MPKTATILINAAGIITNGKRKVQLDPRARTIADVARILIDTPGLTSKQINARLAKPRANPNQINSVLQRLKPNLIEAGLRIGRSEVGSGWEIRAIFDGDGEMENLRERIRELEEAFGMYTDFTPDLDVSPVQKTMLGLLHKRILVSKDQMNVATLTRGRPDRCEKYFDSQVCLLRQRLRPYGIEIETKWAAGYYMTSEMKRRLGQYIVEARDQPAMRGPRAAAA